MAIFDDYDRVDRTVSAGLIEKHDLDDTVFLVDGAKHLQTALRRSGLRFRYEKHGNRNAVERVFR